MSRFSKFTVKTGGGLTPQVWNERFIVQNHRQGEELTTIVLRNQEQKQVPIKDTCLVFTDLKEEFKETRSFRGGNAPQVLAQPLIEKIDLLESFQHWIKDDFNHERINHPSIPTRNIAIIPLCLTTEKQETEHILFQQCARIFISCGANDIDMHDNHVGNMFLCGLKSIAWTLVNETDKEKQLEWFDNLVKLANSAKHYFQTYEEAYEIVEPLQEDDRANDVLIRSLAFIFFPESANVEQMMRIIEVAIKRHNKRFPNESFITKPLTGLIATVVLVPIVRDILNNKITTQEGMEYLNVILTDQIKMIASILSEGKEYIDKQILSFLFGLVNINMQEEQIKQFYEWCKDPKNLTRLAPIEDWSIVPKYQLMFHQSYENVTINTKEMQSVPKFKVNKNNELVLCSTGITEWCAVQLHTAGQYFLKPQSISKANQHESFIKITSSRENDLFRGEESCSINMLEMDVKEIEIEIKQRKIVVKWGRNVMKEMKKSGECLLGFKNVRFIVRYKPMFIYNNLRMKEVTYSEIVQSTVEREIQEDNRAVNEPSKNIEIDYGKIETSNITGNALVQKLAELASNDMKERVRSKENKCIVCCDRVYDCLFNCGHLISCFGCAENLDKCPTCRTNIETKTKVYIG